MKKLKVLLWNVNDLSPTNMKRRAPFMLHALNQADIVFILESLGDVDNGELVGQELVTQLQQNFTSPWLEKWNYKTVFVGSIGSRQENLLILYKDSVHIDRLLRVEMENSYSKKLVLKEVKAGSVLHFGDGRVPIITEITYSCPQSKALSTYRLGAWHAPHEANLSFEFTLQFNVFFRTNNVVDTLFADFNHTSSAKDAVLPTFSTSKSGRVLDYAYLYNPTVTCVVAARQPVIPKMSDHKPVLFELNKAESGFRPITPARSTRSESYQKTEFIAKNSDNFVMRPAKRRSPRLNPY